MAIFWVFPENLRLLRAAVAAKMGNFGWGEPSILHACIRCYLGIFLRHLLLVYRWLLNLARDLSLSEKFTKQRRRYKIISTEHWIDEFRDSPGSSPTNSFGH